MSSDKYNVKGRPTYMDDSTYTPIAKLVWYYLYTRQLEGKGAASKKEIMVDLDIDMKSCRTAINILRKQNVIVSDVMHRAESKPNMELLNASD